MNTKNLIFPFLALFTVSCSLFINKIDKGLLNKQGSSYKKEKDKITYCQEKQSFELISENKKNADVFNYFIKSLAKRYQLTFADKTILWSLVQMNIRPDLSAPTSKFQFFIRHNEGTQFYHVFGKEGEHSLPYLHALDLISKKYQANYTLLKLAEILDQNYYDRYYVSQTFSEFLAKHKNQLIKNKDLKRLYLRGDEVLKPNERISKQRLSTLVKKYYNTKEKVNYKVSNYLFRYERNKKITALCNYDMSLYNSSIYLIHDKMINSNTFGLRSQSSVFMADSTQKFNELELLNNSLFFKGKSQTRSSAMCQFKLPLQEKWKLWLISSQSRDPGQHLFHLLEYGIQDMSDIKQINGMLNFSRHLFLKKPIRLILESQRSNTKQLNELLKLNMPIYNAERLARIWGYHQSPQHQSFIIDSRRPGALSCQ